MAHVVTQFPRMKDVIGTMVLSVNLDYTPTGCVHEDIFILSLTMSSDSTLNLHSGDEIAFIPPIRSHHTPPFIACNNLNATVGADGLFTITIIPMLTQMRSIGLESCRRSE